MKRYEEKGIKCLIGRPGGLLLGRRRQSLRRQGVVVTATAPNHPRHIPQIDIPQTNNE